MDPLRERALAGFLVLASVGAALVSFVASVAIVLHWLLVLVALLALARVGARSTPARVSLLLFVILLAVGLAGAGFGIGRVGSAGSSTFAAPATMVAATSGTVAFAFYLALAGSRPERILGGVGLAGALAGILLLLGKAPEGLIGGPLILGALAGLLAMGVVARRLLRSEASPPPVAA